jgi:hypothetical protein
MPSNDDDLDFLSKSGPDQTGPTDLPNIKRLRRKWAEAFSFLVEHETRFELASASHLVMLRMPRYSYELLAHRSQFALTLATCCDRCIH